MKIQTNQETLEAIKGIIEQQADQPDNIRVYIAGMGCSGPSFGLTLDEVGENDLKDDSNDVTFIMTKEIHEQVGDMLVESVEGGYLVRPLKTPETACGSCGGGCS